MNGFKNCIFLLLFLISSCWCLSFKPTVSCPTNLKYIIDLGSQCYDDSDVYGNVVSSENEPYDPVFHINLQQTLIESHYDNYEFHNVTTDDGYILGLFRIPVTKNRKGVVLLIHPILTDATIWVSAGDGSLVSRLEKNNFEVWLLNLRGTNYSFTHTNTKISKEAYWNFTFHENGLYDFPASLKYIQGQVNEKVIVIGHSSSVTAALIYASMKPTEADGLVNAFFAMSPTAYTGNMTSPLKYISYLVPLIKPVLKVAKVYSLGNEMFTFLFRTGLYNPFKAGYTIFMCILFGWTPLEMEQSLIQHLLSHNPKPFSTKTLYHYTQQIHSGGRFQMYDLGDIENKNVYNQSEPPEYPVEDIVTPFYLMYSDSDWVNTKNDVEKLFEKFSKTASSLGKLNFTGSNLVDFYYGNNRNVRIYDKIFDIINPRSGGGFFSNIASGIGSIFDKVGSIFG